MPYYYRHLFFLLKQLQERRKKKQDASLDTLRTFALLEIFRPCRDGLLIFSRVLKLILGLLKVIFFWALLRYLLGNILNILLVFLRFFLANPRDPSKPVAPVLD